jgi:hypothetical protein
VDLAREADAAPFMSAQIHHHAGALLLNAGERKLELLAAIAAG